MDIYTPAGQSIVEASSGGRRGRRRTGQADVIIGQRVRGIRRARSMSQTELARGIGVTCQQVQKYEVGSSRIAASQLLRIAEVLRVAPTELLSDQAETAEPSGIPFAERQLLLLAYSDLPSDDLRSQFVMLLLAIGNATSSRLQRNSRRGHLAYGDAARA